MIKLSDELFSDHSLQPRLLPFENFGIENLSPRYLENTQNRGIKLSQWKMILSTDEFY